MRLKCLEDTIFSIIIIISWIYFEKSYKLVFKAAFKSDSQTTIRLKTKHVRTL